MPSTLELPADPLFERQDLGKLRFDVGALLDQAVLVRFEHGEEALELRPLVPAGLVHVDQLADLGKRQSEALAAQGQLETGAIARGVDSPLPVAARRDQALVLVEADGARRDLELARELADRILGARL